jgi:hypothetical protein
VVWYRVRYGIGKGSQGATPLEIFIMTFKTDFAAAMGQKDLSNPTEKLCFDVMIETLCSALLADKPESYQKAMLEHIKTTGPNKA